MSEPTYTAEQQRAAAEKLALESNPNYVPKAMAELVEEILHGKHYRSVCLPYVCALTVAEEREKELQRMSDIDRVGREKAEAQLAAIRDAPVPEMPDIYRYGPTETGYCGAKEVEQVFLALTRKIAALEAELATWKSECLENCRLLGISGSVEARLRAEIGELKKLAPRWRSQADGETHWEGCWQDHRHCALAKIEVLEAQLKAKGDAGGWIECGGEIPVPGEYNVTWECRGVRHVSTAWHKGGYWWDDEDNKVGLGHLNIDYYRPLPSLPQDGAKG